MNWHRWRPYVPVAQRRARGNAQVKKELRKGESLAPVQIAGRKIATTFWGKAWCDHFDQYSDYSNRLPRGRTYARNGSIAHLRIESGRATAFVSGSSLYQVQITIKPLAKNSWQRLCSSCATSIHSVIDLMRGKLPDPVIKTLTDPDGGMFPSGSEIKMTCSCPDWAEMCKHLAATIYGIGNRLDESPELLFLLRGVDQHDLIGTALATKFSSHAAQSTNENGLADEDLADIFGIELATDEATPTKFSGRKARSTKKKVGKKNVTNKKTDSNDKATNSKEASKRRPKKKAAKKKPAGNKSAGNKKTVNKETVKKEAKARVAKKKKAAKKSVKKRVTKKGK